MRNFRGEIGRKIRYKMLSFKRIGFYFKMTNENVRLDSSFFMTTKIQLLFKPAILSPNYFSFSIFFLIN